MGGLQDKHRLYLHIKCLWVIDLYESLNWEVHQHINVGNTLQQAYLIYLCTYKTLLCKENDNRIALEYKQKMIDL